MLARIQFYGLAILAVVLAVIGLRYQAAKAATVAAERENQRKYNDAMRKANRIDIDINGSQSSDVDRRLREKWQRD